LAPLSFVFSSQSLLIKLFRERAVRSKSFRDDAITAVEEKIVLAIETIVDVLLVQAIPQICRRFNRGRCAVSATFPAGRILYVRHPLKERAGVTGGRVCVAQHTYFAIDEKIVERHELARELMLNRRDFFAKQSQL